MNPAKVLIIDHFPEAFLQDMQALPVEMTYIPKAPRQQVLQELADTHVLILNSGIQVDQEVLDAAPHLQIAIRAGVGMDHFDLPALEARGVQWKNTKGGNAESVGEQTVGMMLALRHHVVRADQQVRQFQWVRAANRATEIRNKTIGLIGYGFTGQAVAQRLSGFGSKVLAYDKYRENYSDAFAEAASLEHIFEEAEILSMHVPLTNETHHWVGEEFLNRFVRPIHLLNLARGPVVHLPDLLKSLDNGQVLGAGLDVLENEKLHTLSEEQRSWYEDLFSRDNVILTPHIGGWSWESLAQINEKIVGYVKEWLKHS
ncbi:MAG: NAD(P)-dependent oxidoreductase [Bacteroidota bacterium]